MHTVKQLAWLAMLTPLFCAAQQNQMDGTSVRPAPTPPIDMESLVQLHEEIATAPNGTIYSVALQFDKPASLGVIRDLANELQILRALALVEFGRIYDGYSQGRARIGVGVLYNELGSWDREICRPKLIAKSIGDAGLLNTPAEEWQVNEISVLGPAEAIRHLLSGESLPQTMILSGRKQNPRVMDRFAAAIKRQHAEKIQVQDKDDIPEECLKFTNRIQAPILTGTPTIQPAEYGGNHAPDFRTVILDLLASRAPTIPVTLQVTLSSQSSAEDFASLVEKYDVEGLLAELAPEDPSVRISSEAALSIHGGPLAEQVAKIQCHQKVGNSADYDGEWIAQRAQVSLSVSKAWNLVSDSDLIDARLLNEYEAGALRIIQIYHEERSVTNVELPVSMMIPPGCGWYMYHRP